MNLKSKEKFQGNMNERDMSRRFLLKDLKQSNDAKPMIEKEGNESKIGWKFFKECKENVDEWKKYEQKILIEKFKTMKKDTMKTRRRRKWIRNKMKMSRK